MGFLVVAIAWVGTRELGMELVYNGFEDATKHTHKMLSSYSPVTQFCVTGFSNALQSIPDQEGKPVIFKGPVYHVMQVESVCV